MVVAPEISVVIPAYDEAENVPLLAEELRKELGAAGLEHYEVLFVDDGSRDATAEQARREAARDSRFRLLRLARNCGESAATEAGLRHARGAILVVMDADLQNPPADVPRLVEVVRSGAADCACGWRTARGDGDGPFRRFQSRVANAIRNAFTGEDIQDAGCTFRAFRRECIERVKLYRGMHRFLPTLIRLEGYRVAEIPVGNRPRTFGRSKYGMWNRAFAALYDLFAVRWMRTRVIAWRVSEDTAAVGSADTPAAGGA